MIRLIVFICLLCGTAAAQFSPCLMDANPAPTLIEMPGQYRFPGVIPIMIPDMRRVPQWVPREAFIEPAIKINPLGSYLWEFYMPVAGRCVGAFDSYADINGANMIGREMLGQHTGVRMAKPTGDIEVIVFTAAEYQAWRTGRSTTTRGGSAGKQTGGRFAVDLQPGWHVVLLNNAHSGFTAKIVSFIFGGKPPQIEQ